MTTPRTGSTRNPPLAPPRPIFMQPGREVDSDEDVSAPQTPAGNPFGTPAGSMISRGDLSPGLTQSSRVQSTGSGFGYTSYFQPADITMRSSGIVSVGAAGNPFSSGRSQISGLSAGDSSTDVAETSRAPLSRAPSSMMREAFTSPPPRPVTFSQIGSRTASVANIATRPTTKRQKSTMLTGEIEKPWRGRKDTTAR
jgi:hypothetical protein